MGRGYAAAGHYSHVEARSQTLGSPLKYSVALVLLTGNGLYLPVMTCPCTNGYMGD